MSYKGMKYNLLLVVGVLSYCVLRAQEGPLETSHQGLTTLQQLSTLDTLQKNQFVISDIVITGDRKTKSYIIQREIPFKTGDSVTLTALVGKFDIARRQLMNTRLFNEATVSLKGFKGY